MAGVKPLAVQGQAVEHGIRILPFLGNERKAVFQLRLFRPGHAAEGHFPPIFGGEGSITVVIEAELPAADGVPDLALRLREVPERVFLEHADGADGFPQEFLQAVLFQAVAGKAAEAAVDKKLELHAAVQGVGGLVHLAVEEPHQVQEALGEGDAHLGGALLLRILQAVAGQGNLFRGNDGVFHAILLLRSIVR